MNISKLLAWGKEQLIHQTETPQLDVEILLATVLQVTRTYLHTYPERQLTALEHKQFINLLERRAKQEPIAYLIGHKEFWSLDLIVSRHTLIPRPETELLVEKVLQKIMLPDAMIADLGTGSGAIALALAHERPQWQLHATDLDSKALKIAEFNAMRLHINNITFHAGFWCQALPALRFDAIVSNPPYIAEHDTYLQQKNLRFEPYSALVSGKDGLDAILQIINEARHFLKPGGCLFLEHGFQQALALEKLLSKAGYQQISLFQDYAGLDRVTMAQIGN